jgi:hypothetical protein
MVWAAAETFELVAGAALPLALYRDRQCQRTLAARSSTMRARAKSAR